MDLLYTFELEPSVKVFSLRSKYAKASYYSFLCLFIYEWIFWFLGGYGGATATQGAVISIDSFVLLLYISLFLALFNFLKSNWKADLPIVAFRIYALILICNAVAFVRGIASAGNYFEWKGLIVSSTGGLALFMPLVLVTGTKYEYLVKIFRLIFASLVFGLLLIPFQATQSFFSEETFARLMVPAVFVVLTGPYIKTQRIRLIFIILLTSCLLTLEWRSMVVRVFLSCLILTVYYFRKVIPQKVLVSVLIICYILPVYFITNGIITGKSIFANESQSNNSTFVSASGEQQRLTADTRTFLYIDVLGDLSKNGAIIQGKGATARYASRSINTGELKSGRFSVEVGALRIMLMTGLIGLVLYGILNFTAAYQAIRFSNNYLCKMMGLFLATFWLLLFIENIYSYSVNYYLTWVFTGLCLSKSFRKLTDAEIHQLFKITL